MKQLVSVLGTCFILLGWVSSAYSDVIDNLTLSDAEMQKLKKYFPTEEIEHQIWKGDSISINVPLGKEKRVIFPWSVSVDLKSQLTTDQLRIINDNGSVYLTALKEFPKTRIYITLQDSNEVILVDLMVDKYATTATQKIEIQKSNTLHSSALNAQIVATSTSEMDTSDKPTYVEMIRFAWQQVYSPQRLMSNNLNYSRAPMHTQKFVYDLVYGNKVIAYPVSSWVSYNRYVTAVVLRNKYIHKAYINLNRDLCGTWVAATLYPRSILQSSGNKEKDSTMLFLVSNQPFGEAMGVCHGDA